MVPSRWEDRPQAWEEVLAKLAWFDRHARRLRLAEEDVVATARATVEEIEWEHQQQPRRTA